MAIPLDESDGQNFLGVRSLPTSQLDHGGGESCDPPNLGALNSIHTNKHGSGAGAVGDELACG